MKRFSSQSQKDQANDKRGAGYHHGPRPLNNLAGNPAAVPPSVIRAEVVGGSVVPTNGRPNFGGDMGNTPARAVTVTVPGKRENPGFNSGAEGI